MRELSDLKEGLGILQSTGRVRLVLAEEAVCLRPGKGSSLEEKAFWTVQRRAVPRRAVPEVEDSSLVVHGRRYS